MREHIVFKIAKNRLVRAGFLVFLVLMGVGMLRTVYTVSQKRGIVAERKAVLEAEEAKNRELQARLVEATSAAFIERQARGKLGLVKEGETVVILDKSKIQNPNDKVTQPRALPSWKQWWELFF